jgi:hypothetical protein
MVATAVAHLKRVFYRIEEVPGSRPEEPVLLVDTPQRRERTRALRYRCHRQWPLTTADTAPASSTVPIRIRGFMVRGCAHEAVQRR